MPNDLLIFDCDGVLVDSEPLALQALHTVLNEAGVPATVDLVMSCFGMKQADALRRIGAATGHPVPPDVPERLWPVTRQLFEAGLEAMPGVVDALRSLPPDLRRCVASSSQPERIRVSLALTGLAPWFEPHLFSSSAVLHGKPAPDLFLLAAARMGVMPCRCAVIEDSVFGIEAARAAGMTAFGFTGGGHVGPGHAAVLQAAGAVAVAADWAEAARLLAA
ncbi:HAD family hydrolase [Lichenihabitans sp. Uapishka_5]|uniref:HAD family hydrolase n=1 Tax=Lichenihabitans sp. Uapishka_5 TaxID=3037302 RepID=UPI0029E7DD24|nr:HAD family hydrolase [Lichenihabitans sp. Uapishka_5]MDX7953504.1 HAD family hydrolase [Lichenihabitans sp. Uapishka_5]